MSGRPVRCGNCSNGNMEYLSFSPDGQYVYCGICGTSTPLYDSYVIQEHTGEVKVAGFRTLQDRLENGNSLLQLKKYQDAEQEFLSLTKEYASNCETWFGLARATSQDFSSLDRYDETTGILENAKTVAKQENRALQRIDAAGRYYSALHLNSLGLAAARQSLCESENRHQGVLSSHDAASLDEKKRELIRCEKDQPQGLSTIHAVIFIVLIAAAIICFRNAGKVSRDIETLISNLSLKGFSYEEISAYISNKTNYVQLIKGYYTGRIISVIAALVYTPFFSLRVRNGYRRTRNLDRTEILKREISQLETLVDSDIRESESAVSSARRQVAKYEQELARLQAVYRKERTSWT